MMISVLYFVSVILLFWMLVFLPKTEKKLSFVIWIVPIFLVMEYYACAVGGILTIFYLPADMGTIALANFALAAFLFFLIRKTGKIQKWSFSKKDLVAFTIVAAIAVLFVALHYTADLSINFETSDPSLHMQMAMDSMNLHSVMSLRSFMYVGQFTNSLFLQFWKPLVSAELLYKVFILKLVLNWAISGWMFYSCIAHRRKSLFGYFLAIFCTVGYFCGYPLTDLIFGFVYLQQCVTTCMMILFVLERVQNEELSLFQGIPVLSICCLSASLGYTLFGVTIFISLALAVTIWYWRKNRTVFRREYFKIQFSIFLFPTIMTVLYAFVIINRYRELDAAELLSTEGYIYRNLYSDFILLVPLALFGFLILWKTSRDHFLVSLVPVFTLTAVVLFAGLLLGYLSGYYYYKLNFLLWFVLWACTAVALLYLDEKIKALAVSFFVCGVFLSGMFLLGVESRLNDEGIQVAPNIYTMSETWFRNYDFNLQRLSDQTKYSDGKVVLYQQTMDYMESSEKSTYFIGYWLDNYWFQAFSNQRENTVIELRSAQDVAKVIETLDSLEPGCQVIFMSNWEKYMLDAEQASNWGAQITAYLDSHGQLLYENQDGKVYQWLGE